MKFNGKQLSSIWLWAICAVFMLLLGFFGYKIINEGNVPSLVGLMGTLTAILGVLVLSCCSSLEVKIERCETNQSGASPSMLERMLERMLLDAVNYVASQTVHDPKNAAALGSTVHTAIRALLHGNDTAYDASKRLPSASDASSAVSSVAVAEASARFNYASSIRSAQDPLGQKCTMAQAALDGIKGAGMSTNDQTTEALILAKGLTAPRVMPADIEANIVHTEIVKHIAPSGQVLRWAVLTTRNGFAVTGKPSASVSPANDDAEVGEKVAIENARSELWPLMGYELRSKLAA